jgi:hypothetical protein
MNSSSIFDCLAIGNGIQSAMGNFSPEELHIFGYLGCLLSLYRKQSVSEWGYSFIVSEEGVPFSHDIFESFDYVRQLGFLNSHDHYYRLSSVGESVLEQLKSLVQHYKRLPMLEGACESLLAIPMNIVRDAITNVPEIKRATAAKSARKLLVSPGLEQLYKQFQVLSTTFGVEIPDLMIPATAWLSYLAQEG